MTTRRTGWRALIEWGLAVGLIFFAVLSLTTIGIFVAPLALAACWLASRRNRTWPEGPMGGSVGIGLVCLIIAYLNRHYAPCSNVPSTIPLGQRFWSCGGLDPLPWLAAGGVLIGAGLLAYILVRRATVNGADRVHTRDAL